MTTSFGCWLFTRPVLPSIFRAAGCSPGPAAVMAGAERARQAVQAAARDSSGSEGPWPRQKQRRFTPSRLCTDLDRNATYTVAAFIAGAAR